MICYGQIRGHDWVQEHYETSTSDARKRAVQLRKLGYRVTSCALGYQVTSVGTVKMTVLTISGTYDQLCDLPTVKVERL